MTTAQSYAVYLGVVKNKDPLLKWTPAASSSERRTDEPFSVAGASLGRGGLGLSQLVTMLQCRGVSR